MLLARHRCADLANETVRCGSSEHPEDEHDLIHLSVSVMFCSGSHLRRTSLFLPLPDCVRSGLQSEFAESFSAKTRESDSSHLPNTLTQTPLFRACPSLKTAVVVVVVQKEYSFQSRCIIKVLSLPSSSSSKRFSFLKKSLTIFKKNYFFFV